MGRRKYNPERRAWRGRSYKVAGRNRGIRIAVLRFRAWIRDALN